MKKTDLIRLFCVAMMAAALILSLSRCSKQEPQPTPKYEHTIEEAFEIIHSCGIPEFKRLTLNDLNAYRDSCSANRTLADSLVNPDNYFCINYKKNNEERSWYVENSVVLLNFLTSYGETGVSVWDTNNDQVINTTDLMEILVGFNVERGDQPDFDCYDPLKSFGEGNTHLEYLCGPPPPFFGWFHRSPYDEEYAIEGDANSLTYDLYSFTFDEIREENHFYVYIRP